MIHLRSFGVVELSDPKGEPLRAIMSQPKRLALLLRLVTGRPMATASRIRLLGLLWPDLDDAHARNALNKSLHFLRKELPEGVLVSLGRTRLAVAPSEVDCDAVIFRTHVEMGADARALELYTGDFLPGLYVSDAPAFEQWLDGERIWYRLQARSAALRLLESDLTKGRHRAALEWCTVLSRLAPTDEVVVRAIVHARMRAGDRAGALECLERYETWLRENLEMGVPADLVRLLAESTPASEVVGVPSSPGEADPDPELLAASREAVKVETLDEYEDFVRLLPDMVFRCDLRGSFPFVNEAAVQTMGWSREEFRDLSYDELVREDFRDRVIDFYVLQVDDRIPNTYLEFPAITKDGREIWVGQRVRLLERDGLAVGIEAVTRDITARVRRERANRRSALEDRETRLLNRDGFALAGNQRIRENRRGQEPFFCIHVRVSLEGGESEGATDFAVRVLGGILGDAVRECDVLGRLGEAEIVILSAQGGQEQAGAMRERVSAILAAAQELEELVPMTVRCESVAHDPARLRSAEALMTFAWVV